MSENNRVSMREYLESLIKALERRMDAKFAALTQKMDVKFAALEKRLEVVGDHETRLRTVERQSIFRTVTMAISTGLAAIGVALGIKQT